MSQTSNDFRYFVTWVQNNFSRLENNRINLVSIPMGTSGKPAMVIRLPREDYNAYSRFGNIEGMGWNYYEHGNYILFALEVYISIPNGKYCFRQFFDPVETSTLNLINSWISLEGDDVLFFVGSENLNYISGPTPNKVVAREVLSEARTKLASIPNKGSFSSALRGLINTVPFYERTSL